jgi:uncharacterized protein involved in outer membrane biogenesis
VKWLLRALGVALALAALAIGVLAWAGPRLAKSEAARAKIEAAAHDALGRDLRYGDIDFGLLPPSLLVLAPVVAGEAAGDPPLLRAERVALRVALWPLLRGELEVASLAIDGLALHLVRTKAGLGLPGPSKKESEPRAPSQPKPGGERGAGGPAFEIREVAVRGGSLVLEDRSAEPEKTWTIADVEFTAHSDGSNRPIAIAGSLRDMKGGALAVAGKLALEAELDRLGAGATGPFSIDARAANVTYGADFAKPAGTPAALRGRIAADEAGALRIDDLVVELNNLVAHGALRTAPQTELSLSAAAFTLDGWQALVPPLGFTRPSGRVAIPKLSLALAPLAVRGEIALDGLVAKPPDMAPVALQGALLLLGSELRTRDLVARAADQPIRVDARVEKLFDGPSYEVSFEMKGADSNALLSGYAKQRDRLLGPLDAQGTLRGTTSGGASLLDALSGNLEFGIEGGRIVGVSLLEAVLGSFGSSVAEAVRQQGGKDWERFTSDRFESLRGVVRIENGRLVTAPLTLTYPDWGAQLEGPIRLSDLGLDLVGRFTIKEKLDAALARAFGAHRDYVPEVRVVDLASVRGVPGAPKVQLSGSGVAQIAAAYAGKIEADQLKKRLEKKLGPGSGELVDQGLGVLQDLLGGKKK